MTSRTRRSAISLQSGRQEESFDLEMGMMINDLYCTHVLALKEQQRGICQFRWTPSKNNINNLPRDTVLHSLHHEHKEIQNLHLSSDYNQTTNVKIGLKRDLFSVCLVNGIAQYFVYSLILFFQFASMYFLTLIFFSCFLTPSMFTPRCTVKVVTPHSIQVYP
jgi:hypothetical protein